MSKNTPKPDTPNPSPLDAPDAIKKAADEWASNYRLVVSDADTAATIRSALSFGFVEGAIRATAPSRTETVQVENIRNVQKEEFCTAAPSASAGQGERKEWPECKDFYDRMQRYRIAPFADQKFVIECYEDVKKWLRAAAPSGPGLGELQMRNEVTSTIWEYARKFMEREAGISLDPEGSFEDWFRAARDGEDSEEPNPPPSGSERLRALSADKE